MSEQQTEATAPKPTPPAQATTPTEAPPVVDETTDWKAEARKWEQRAKDNKTAADRLAEIDEASKTEAQKSAEREAAAEKRAAAAEAKAVRREVALEESLSADDAALLDAITDEDAMRALAKRLASDKKRSNVVPNEGRTPTPGSDQDMRAFTRDLFRNAEV